MLSGRHPGVAMRCSTKLTLSCGSTVQATVASGSVYTGLAADACRAIVELEVEIARSPWPETFSQQRVMSV